MIKFSTLGTFELNLTNIQIAADTLNRNIDLTIIECRIICSILMLLGWFWLDILNIKPNKTFTTLSKVINYLHIANINTVVFISTSLING